MAKSKTRKPFTGYASDKDARKPRSVEGQGPSQPVKTAVRVDTGSSAQAHSVANTASHEAGRRRTPSGKFLIPAAVGAIGGGAYLAHRHKQRKTVIKSLIEPISGREVVVKATGGAYSLRAAAKQGARRLVPSQRKQGALLAGATAVEYDRSSGGHDTRVRFRNELRNTAPEQRSREFTNANGEGDKTKARFAEGRRRYREGGNVRKSISPLYGARNAYTGPASSAKALVPTGKHVGRANDLGHFTPTGGSRRTPSGLAAQNLLRVTKSDFVPRLGTSDVDRISTYARQVGSRGRRIA